MGNRIQRRFDYLREQTERDVNQQQQQAAEGLQRQAAAKGRLGSGAFQKQQAQQQKQAADIRQQAIGDVESQREAALAQQEEVQAQRDFQKAEREAGQNFAAQQSQINRDYSTSERLAGQNFNEKLFDKDAAFKQKAMDLQESQFGQQMQMAMQQFGLDKKVSEFNMKMANQQANKMDFMDILLPGQRNKKGQGMRDKFGF